MTDPSKHAETLRKINSARDVARILGPKSAWINEEQWGLRPEMQEKVQKIAGVAELSDAARGQFFETIAFAIVDYQAASVRAAQVNTALKRLEHLKRNVAALATSWRECGRDLRVSIHSQLRGGLLLPRSATAAPPPTVDDDLPDLAEVTRCAPANPPREQMMSEERLYEAAAFADRARQFMQKDGSRLNAEIDRLIGALKDCSVRNAFAARFAWSLATAWLEATGRCPTYTGSEKVAGGKQRTAFQLLVDTVTPGRPIGDKIVREIVEASRFRLGALRFRLGALKSAEPRK